MSVILNGDGADELFGGYRRYVPFALGWVGAARALSWLVPFLPKSHNQKSRDTYALRLLSMAHKQGAALYASPMAMKPFIGYNVGDYWNHWLEMGEKLGDKAPKIFNVNWFKQDEEGNFIWPGFGDNMRVLDWIIKRCEGEIDAEETAIGYLPKKGDIDVSGIEDEVTPECNLTRRT